MSKRNLIIILSLIFIIANLSNVYGETDISSNQGNFSQLNQIIDNSNNSIELDEDYKAVTFEDKISISKSVDIDGNNHSINSDRDIKLNVNNSKVVFKHINFNRNICINNCNSSDITFLDCYFNLQTNSYLIMKYETVNSSSKTDMPSIIKYFAQNIVGKSTGLAAAKKLAKWVGKNVKHEKTEGFYQSPEITLERKSGNCCSQTNLFLQMCDALGILKKHKAYFVHTGNMKFKERHFFAVIDNIVIDVDSHPTSPWGHANFKSGGIFSMTLFPKLPLPKNY